MQLGLLISILVCHLVSCQRYAERNPLPVPLEETYDEYYSEGYDFDENKNIYRWNVDDFPHPLENPRNCGRIKSSHICDPDGVLDKDEADKLDNDLMKIYKGTPCLCKECNGGGIVISIALMKNVYQPYNEHPSQIIRSFAEKLREKWKLGKCNNDILIVVATTDRLSYTDVGQATSQYVSLKEAYRIFLENKADFSAGHFYEGLRGMLTDYYVKTKEIRIPSDENKLNHGLIVGCVVGVVVLLAVLLLVAVLVYRRYKRIPGKSSDEVDGKTEGVPSNWTKKDIKVMWGSLKSTDKSTKYTPCDTEEKSRTESNFKIDEDEEEIDTTLATTTTDTTTSEILDKELSDAVENITYKSFKPRSPESHL